GRRMLRLLPRSSCAPFRNSSGSYAQPIQIDSLCAFEVLIGRSVDEGSMPQLECQKPPEMGRVVATVAAMLVQNLYDDALIEVAALPGSSIGQCVIEQLSQFIVEPPADRNAKPLLWPIDDLIGNQSSNRGLQNMFSDRAAKLERRRNRLNKLDQLVIEQRLSRFNGVGHAHSIDLRQNVSGQISLAVEI